MVDVHARGHVEVMDDFVGLQLHVFFRMFQHEFLGNLFDGIHINVPLLVLMQTSDQDHHFVFSTPVDFASHRLFVERVLRVVYGLGLQFIFDVALNEGDLFL